MSKEKYETYDDWQKNGGENAWQKKWEKWELYKADDKSDKPKKYILDMFPYPSGAGLHVGHPEGYTATDIYSRYLRMNGFNVLHPMGWDAFGLPAENYAIKQGVHPDDSTHKNINRFREQIKSLGLSYDWPREVDTSSPDYYKWTQWFFLFLYKNGLAYKKKAKVNWCSSCQTVLANEQVISGKCERCGNDVTQKDLAQWFFKITDYADRLISDLDKINWPEPIKTMQRNWIGKSEGEEIEFKVLIDVKNFVRLGFKTQPNTDLKNNIRTTWFLTFSTKEREEFFNTKEECLYIINAIFNSCLRHGFTLHEVSAMKDHVHIILDSDKNMTIEKMYKYLKGYSAKKFNQKFDKNWENSKGAHVWMPKGEYSIIKDENQYKSILQYVQNNPEKDGLLRKERLLSENFNNLYYILNIFTTRPDTLFGATYMVLAPEHELVEILKNDGVSLGFKTQANKKIKNQDKIESYLELAKNKSDLQRTDLNKEKTGVELKGIKAINPANNEEIPVWIADYVLSTYGTGAIMAVPAHDERDWEFARKYNLSIVEVILGGNVKQSAYINSGKMINSGEFDGLASEEAKKKIAEKVGGKLKTQYKLRDWLVSRQRYWGAPIPIIYCDKCGEVPVSEKDLPVVLPKDVDFKPTGESPLVHSKSFHNVKCPHCGAKARRESDTMDTFVCSSWYYFRYTDPKNKKEFAGKKQMKKWLPVDLYVGGAEHAVLHLMYARFFTKALFDHGYIDFDEPFLKLRNQGMILAEDGRKMSKSLGNVINPDEVVKNLGADSMRLYEMFMGPLEDAKPWQTRGIVGVRRFLERVWTMQSKVHKVESQRMKILLHKTIKKVTEDIENMKFNTAVSAMMIFTNEAQKEGINKDDFVKFLIILAPFAPHIVEELWDRMGNKKSIFKEPWPKYNEELIKEDVINLVLQINGKVRDSIEVPADISEEEAKEKALASEKARKWTKGKGVAKVIVVKNRLVNIVIK
ncbi:leucine--tRNA ligase [Candidatus Falkowbacteria bacterium CG10_big_fil_rev_8_21_14_0_10_43_11]|uniref:Leucine--tRNA ligase n=1 Tax=Candidatus Falkowbacteria bacterium CG10_big_fil_rev_8_21_14_0_10_43_11 TaxID=1974568 RepID=A0A2M6WN80_9BACT|nr:MAG: leucine--tRNA ligase [Candidatus Falkowbacteria bacterium CG10_big_fil_rev_8_21_14_0_10_43_11]